MPANALTLVPLTADQAEALSALPELMEYVRRSVPGLQHPVSAQAAARLAKRRTSTVLGALKSGDLRGEFISGTHGGRGHWLIDPAAVLAWARRFT